MCGINGIYGKIPDRRERVAAMTQALSHRGPDAEGIFVDTDMALGHRRLSVIDLSDGSNQPMSDASGRYTLVFNGEIYNFKSLRATLGAYHFQTSGDTEVLLAGLIRWGVGFLKECNGMFAFGFWDAQKKELLLGRDRLGIKPLYYARSGENLIFSSEIRSLLKSGLVPKALNKSVLGEYLRYQTVNGSNTLVDGVFMLPPGALMTVNEDEERIEIFWELARSAEMGGVPQTYTDTTNLIRTRFKKAVESRLVSDVPFGAFLSGGIDSSAIVGVAAGFSSKPLRTFTITFDEAEFSEAKYARMVADKFQTDHNEVRLSPNALIEDLPAAIAAMDHPSGDGINTYVVSKAAKESGITMVLSGLGGDELFAGYPIFQQISELQGKKWLLSFPSFMRRAMGSARAMAVPGVASEKITQVICEPYFDTEYAYQYSREVASREVNRQLLNVPLAGSSAVFDMVHAGVGYDTPGFRLPLLSRISYAELTTYLHSVLLRDTDQMSMAHALEVRVPFLDHALVQTVLGVPDKFKYPTSPKKLFVDAMGDLLPPEIVNRPKMGFSFPFDQWLRNELKSFCGDHIAALGARPEFNAKALGQRWNAFLKHDPHVGWSRIWYLCILEAWLSQNGID